MKSTTDRAVTHSLLCTINCHNRPSIPNRYGQERYEKRDLQRRVRKRFDELRIADETEGRLPWHVINAAQSVENVQADIVSVVQETLNQVADGKPLHKLWTDGSHELKVVDGPNDVGSTVDSEKEEKKSDVGN